MDAVRQYGQFAIYGVLQDDQSVVLATFGYFLRPQSIFYIKLIASLEFTTQLRYYMLKMEHDSTTLVSWNTFCGSMRWDCVYHFSKVHFSLCRCQT